MSVNPELRSLDIAIPAQPDSLVKLSLLMAEDEINLAAVSRLIESVHAELSRLGIPNDETALEDDEIAGAIVEPGLEAPRDLAIARPAVTVVVDADHARVVAGGAGIGAELTGEGVGEEAVGAGAVGQDQRDPHGSLRCDPPCATEA